MLSLIKYADVTLKSHSLIIYKLRLCYDAIGRHSYFGLFIAKGEDSHVTARAVSIEHCNNEDVINIRLRTSLYM